MLEAVSLPDPSTVRYPGPWTHRDVHANGIRLHAAEIGPTDPDAPLVVFLHGFADLWWTWRHQLPDIAASGYVAAAMDLRGYGQSDKPPRGYDPQTLAADVAGVIGSLGHRSAVLVGHGVGGLAVGQAISRYPARAGVLVAPVTGGLRTVWAAFAHNLTGTVPGLFGSSLRLRRRQLFGRELPVGQAQAYANRLGDPDARAGRLRQRDKAEWSGAQPVRRDARRHPE